MSTTVSSVVFPMTPRFEHEVTNDIHGRPVPVEIAIPLFLDTHACFYEQTVCRASSNTGDWHEAEGRLVPPYMLAVRSGRYPSYIICCCSANRSSCPHTQSFFLQQQQCGSQDKYRSETRHVYTNKVVESGRLDSDELEIYGRTKPR